MGFKTGLIVTMLLFALSHVYAVSPWDEGHFPISEETEACLDCHASLHPGLVGDWKAGRHARHTPGQALERPALSRRMSTTDPPEQFRDVVVGCYECHSLRTESHADSFEHYDFQINVVVSPPDCATCHPVEVEQYSHSKKANVLDNLRKNPVYHKLVETITSVKSVTDGQVVNHGSSANAKKETCYACHGAEVTVTGTKTVEVEGEEVIIPALSNWPTQGGGAHQPRRQQGVVHCLPSEAQFFN